MYIKLSKHGPAMWFLGVPKAIKVSLNYQNPGPVEVDFPSLSDIEQQQILAGVETGQLESDVAFEELQSIWLGSRPAVEPEVVDQSTAPDPHQQFREAMAKDIAQRVQKRKAMQEEQAKKFDEKVAYLLKQNVRTLKAALTGEQDERLVQALLRRERVGKKRTVAIKLLEEKLRLFEAKRSKEISEIATQQINLNPLIREKTKVQSVIDSEQETILFTPEDLVKASEE